MKNREIAEIFNKIADMLEIEEANPFRIRAYRNASQQIDSLAEDIEALAKENKLENIPGVGNDLAQKIAEYLAKGSIKACEGLKKEVPAVTLDLMAIPGVGAKTAKLLVSELKVKSLEGLEKKLRKKNLEPIPGVKEKTISNILRGLQFLKKSKGRTNIGIAHPFAEEILSRLKSLPEVKDCRAAGSLRRMKETVRDIDILVTSKNAGRVMDFFVKLPQVKNILAHGPTKSSVMARNGIQLDLRVVEPESFGAAMAYFTGSKTHNIKLREIASKKGWKLNEYGLFSGKANKKIAGREEKDIYKALGLSYIVPQLREDTGEIELSRENKLPKLVELKDMKGDLHVHSEYSDGASSIKAMALAAKAKGYEYMAITDHSPSLKVAGGLSEKDLFRQIDEIRKLNRLFKNFKILAGSEVDIKTDGSMDLSDGVLKELDFVIAAIHTGFKQPKERQTARIMKAMENKHVNVIAHLSGRLIGTRDSYEVDLAGIMETAKSTNTALEINAYPLRLDLTDSGCRQAKGRGVKMAINTDSHAAEHLDMMIYGVSVAQRGWLTKEDVLNTRPLGSFLKEIKK